MGTPKNYSHITVRNIEDDIKYHVSWDQRRMIDSTYSTVHTHSGEWGASEFETLCAMVLDISGQIDPADNLPIDYSPDYYFASTPTISGNFEGIDDKLYGINLDSPHDLSGDYTLQLSDVGKSIWNNSSSPAIVTIPINTIEAIPVNTRIVVVMEGVGTVTVTASNGVTLNGVLSPTVGGAITAQYTSVTLVKRDVNTWIAIGNIGQVV